MRKNLASVIILGATMALSLSVVSPAIAAQYPPSITHVTVDNSNVAVGDPKGKFQDYRGTSLVKINTLSRKVDTTQVLSVQDLGKKNAGKTVPTTIKNPDGTSTKLPNLVIDARGVIKSDGIVFKKKGTYVVTFKLPDGTNKVTTFIVG